MYKKIRALILVIVVSFLMVGCGIALDKSNGDTNHNNEGEVQLPIEPNTPSSAFSNEYKTILMENVASSDILLFKRIAFTSIEFNVRDSITYSVGKDFYRISFLSSANPKDIYDAYVEYLDEVTSQHANEYQRTIEGRVNGLPIAVNIVLEFSENLGGYPVSVRISEKPSEFQDENLYYNEYPELVELYNIKNRPDYYYLENYVEAFKQYYISFLTTSNSEDFVEFYTENYSQKANFLFKEDEYQKRLSWIESGYEHKVLLQLSNNMVGIYVDTKLP